MSAPRNRILIIGAGKMGEAILAGWISSAEGAAAAIRPADIEAVEPGEERRAYLQKTYGISCVADVADVSARPDVVVLAVKPQVMSGVLENVSQAEALKPAEGAPLFISIAAGLSTELVAKGLPASAPLVRVMPNVNLSIGAGASGVCASASATPDQVEYVRDLFGCLGSAVVVDESDMDTVCALSGSGPAYVAAMVEALRDAAAAHGLERSLAETLALQTVLGTARLIDEGTQTVAQVRESVCSPGGTTLAALDAMSAAGFDSVFKAGVDAAVRRSKELAECS